MIRRIKGALVDVLADSVLIETGGLCYEVSVPALVRDRIAERELGTKVELQTFHYLSNDQSKSVPYLLGFENDTQREFFLRLLDVPRVGPQMALRMMVLPVGTFAKAIELQDARKLQSLPGVGKQKAKDIIATLQGKLGQFVDVRELEAEISQARPLTETEADALAVLSSLGLSEDDAVTRIQAVIAADPAVTTPEEIVRRVFAGR